MEPIDIDDFPDYTLHPDGKIFSKKTSRFLVCGKDDNGYIQANLRPPIGKRKTLRLHRLLAQHFIPKQEGDGDLVDHINNDRTDNALSNLRWATPEENGQNTKAKNRHSYCIRWNRNRKVFEVSIPQTDGSSLYVGRTETQEDGILMRDNALKGIFPKIQREPTYCITHRPEYQRFEVSIPVGPRKYQYLGHGKTLEEAQLLRDRVLDEREKDPNTWKPKMMGKVMYITQN